MMFMFLIVLMIIIYGCQSDIENSNEPNNTRNNNDEEKPLVTMTMEEGGEIEIELYPNKASNTVNNSIALIADDFYDGLIVHRVIPDNMLWVGARGETGMGGRGYSIKGEFSSNDFDNDLKHEPGILSMARSQDPDSAGSQFFIVTGDGSHLDGDYAAFGKVIDGMDVVEDIEAEETDNND